MPGSPGKNVVGVDGCRAGWFAVWTNGDDSRQVECGLFSNFSVLWEAHRDARCILVDIPIGLTRDTPRHIEPLMRQMLGVRSSTVFPVPCKASVYANDYVSACAENQAHYGKKISRQAWNICPKIKEMNQFLRAHPEAIDIVGEAHPELVFAILAGEVLIASKKSEEGIQQRLATLARYRVASIKAYDGALRNYQRKDVARDDVVDAMALSIAAENACHTSVSAQEQTGDGGIPVRMHTPSPESLLSSPDFIC